MGKSPAVLSTFSDAFAVDCEFDLLMILGFTKVVFVKEHELSGEILIL